MLPPVTTCSRAFAGALAAEPLLTSAITTPSHRYFCLFFLLSMAVLWKWLPTLFFLAALDLPLMFTSSSVEGLFILFPDCWYVFSYCSMQRSRAAWVRGSHFCSFVRSHRQEVSFASTHKSSFYIRPSFHRFSNLPYSSCIVSTEDRHCPPQVFG